MSTSMVVYQSALDVFSTKKRMNSLKPNEYCVVIAIAGKIKLVYQRHFGVIFD